MNTPGLGLDTGSSRWRLVNVWKVALIVSHRRIQIMQAQLSVEPYTRVIPSPASLPDVREIDNALLTSLVLAPRHQRCPGRTNRPIPIAKR